MKGAERISIFLLLVLINCFFLVLITIIFKAKGSFVCWDVFCFCFISCLMVKRWSNFLMRVSPIKYATYLMDLIKSFFFKSEAFLYFNFGSFNNNKNSWRSSLIDSTYNWRILFSVFSSQKMSKKIFCFFRFFYKKMRIKNWYFFFGGNYFWTNVSVCSCGGLYMM